MSYVAGCRNPENRKQVEEIIREECIAGDPTTQALKLIIQKDLGWSPSWETIQKMRLNLVPGSKAPAPRRLVPVKAMPIEVEIPRAHPLEDCLKDVRDKMKEENITKICLDETGEVTICYRETFHL